MANNHRPQRLRSLQEQHEKYADHGCLDDIPNTCPPMIGAEQERRDENQKMAIAYIGLEYMTRAPAENDFLAVGNKGKAEHNVD